MKSAVACLLLFAGVSNAIDNGIGLLPPMGWRSWNCFHADVDQWKMEQIMDVVTSRQRLVNGVPTSLADLGYTHIGLDDNWQQCGSGVNGSFHDANGKPLINTQRFPNMKAMTSYGQNKGLKVGWYGNNCICKEKNFHDPEYIRKHMEQTVMAAVRYGYDGIKLDGCGQFRNLTWFAELFNQSGRPVMIENCHWGGTVPGQQGGDGPCSGTTPISDCPYNFYRTSGDIRNNFGSMFNNLQTTVKFLGNPPLSRPGAWAYPDMLEVGNLRNYQEDRSHFGAWAITSSPLILGHNLLNETTNEKIWDIITNTEVIAVSQTWAGHPGRRVKTFDPAGENRGGKSLQIWAKKLSTYKQAVFVLSNSNQTHTVDIDLTSVGFGPSDTLSVRDLYRRQDIGAARNTYTTDSIIPHDSRMYIFENRDPSA